ncbi:MAG: DTW domain-containing protein [Alphaproteobacteria bacterium]|nr:DTW domain-containing protein [Alphaproteobacteria bacterium]
MSEDREACIDCRRPRPLCVCGVVSRVRSRVGVTVVQHPGERDHPFNTARLLRLALEGVALHTAWDGTVERPELPEGAAVLYPAPDATLLGEGPPPSHLVVLDGTWPQAKALWRENAWIRDLPAVALAPTEPSTYRIRREPSAHCLSTIEATAAALRAIEPDTPGLDRLLDGFDALVDGQIAELAGRERQPRRVRRSARETLLEKLGRRWEDVVVVYAETTPVRGCARGRGIDVLQLAAVRPATGATFDVLASVREVPDAHLLGHMELDATEVSDAAGFDALASAWASFARPDDLHVAWSQAGARLALGRLGLPEDVVHLKPLYCNLRGPRAGRPDEIVEREGLDAPRVDVRGRAGARLGWASAIAAFLADVPG